MEGKVQVGGIKAPATRLKRRDLVQKLSKLEAKIAKLKELKKSKNVKDGDGVCNQQNPPWRFCGLILFYYFILVYFSYGYESSLIRRFQLTKFAIHSRTLIPFRSLSFDSSSTSASVYSEFLFCFCLCLSASASVSVSTYSTNINTVLNELR